MSLAATLRCKVASSGRVTYGRPSKNTNHFTSKRPNTSNCTAFHRAQTRANVPAAVICRSAAADQVPAPIDDPDTAREAIQSGLSLTQQQRWAEALALFEQSLTLPGTGLKRFRGKPNELSEGEKITALYNIACCHAKLGDDRSGLVALAGCLEAGYRNVEQLRKDPDLQQLREDARFEGLVQRFEPKGQGFDLFGVFGGKS